MDSSWKLLIFFNWSKFLLFVFILNLFVQFLLGLPQQKRETHKIILIGDKIQLF